MVSFNGRWLLCCDSKFRNFFEKFYLLIINWKGLYFPLFSQQIKNETGKKLARKCRPVVVSFNGHWLLCCNSKFGNLARCFIYWWSVETVYIFHCSHVKFFITLSLWKYNVKSDLHQISDPISPIQPLNKIGLLDLNWILPWIWAILWFRLGSLAPQCNVVLCVVGLVDSNWILPWIWAILWFCSGSLAVQCNVVLCVTCHESNLGECFDWFI